MSNLMGLGKRSLGSVPALADLTDRVLFGEVWERQNLAKRDRSLITIACLIALCRAEQLPFHLQTGLDNGLTKTELEEVVTHLAFYAGWPAAVTAARFLDSISATSS